MFLIQYWKSFFKNWGIIIISGCIFFPIATFLILGFFPKIYEAKTTIIPMERESLSKKIEVSDISKKFFPGLTGRFSTSKYLINILQSRTIAERIVKKLELSSKYYSLTKRKSVRLLRKMTKIRNTGNELIEITVYAKSAKWASIIANEYITQLRKFIIEDVHSSAKAQRILIEAQLAKTKDGLSKIEDELKKYKISNKILYFPKDVETMIKKIAELKVELTKEEINIALLKKSMTDEHPEVKITKVKIDEIKNKLAESEVGDETNEPGFLEIPISKIPEQEIKLNQLTRKVAIQEAIYKTLFEQYELTKIAEVEEETKFSVLDIAIPPEYPSKPRKKFSMLFAGTIWLIGSTFIFSLIEEFKRT